jgi:hypothetical protein
VLNIKQGRYGAFSVIPQYYRRPIADFFLGVFYIYRHPLQEQTVDTFVPNDILIVGGAGIGSCPAVHGEGDDLMSEGSVRGNSVVICTGANACGKVKKPRSWFPSELMHASNVFMNDGQSVYLKQVRSLAKIFFRKIFGPRLDCYYAGIKGRADTVNGTSRHSLTCYISSG